MEDEGGVEAFGALSNISSSQISIKLVHCWGTLIKSVMTMEEGMRSNSLVSG
jgi:hypothetical protein